jgi:Protein of unknown function (DUF2892)
MSKNVGTADRIARVVIALLLIAYAIPLGFPTQVGIGSGGLARYQS